MSPRRGIFVCVLATRLRIEPADDHRLLIVDDELRLGGALRERDDAERADRRLPGHVADLLGHLEAYFVESLRCGTILTWCRRPAAAPSRRSRRSLRARRAPRRPPRPPRRGARRCPPTFVCSGMFWPTLISAGMLSVARMCGVDRMSASFVLASALISTPNAGIEMPVPRRFSVPGDAGTADAERERIERSVGRAREQNCLERIQAAVEESSVRC